MNREGASGFALKPPLRWSYHLGCTSDVSERVVEESEILTRSFDSTNQLSRYAPLGLIANPFLGIDVSPTLAEACEVTSESNGLLQAIVRAASQDAPKPIWVTKDNLIPNSFALAAESRVEQTMASDESADLLHAYIPLFGMRSGAARSAVNLLSERLVFRDLEHTLVMYLERLLAEPDAGLASYQVVGPEALEAFGVAFAKDARAAVQTVFGAPENERQADIGEMADFRQTQFEGDEETPTDDAAEIDETVGDAPGTHLVDRNDEVIDGYNPADIADYIIDYTRERFSPVIGRALRVYRDRGAIATAAEFNITKAPRKTLAAVVKFARVRYRKVVIMWDGFDNWLNIDADLRSKIVGMLSELRWTLANDAVLVFLVGEGTAPELEESFSSGDSLRWDFAGFSELVEEPDALKPKLVDSWLAHAAVPDGPALTFDSPVLAPIIEASGGSFDRFIRIAAEAIEDAADNNASAIGAENAKRAVAVVDAPEPEPAQDDTPESELQED